MCRALTAFADDVRIGQEVRSVEDFLNATVRLGHVLQLLVDARMMINTTKSVILLSVPQSYAKKWRRREIVSDQDGSKLRVSTVSTGTFHLPIVESHKYLGAVITSPDECSQLTVFYRLHQASAAWSRLRPALTSASVPALPLRLRLWRACIPPTALYALDSLPLTPGQITQVQQYLTRQLRALARSQAHTMLETTLGLHNRLQVPMVHETLWKAAERQRARMARVSSEEAYLASPDWPARIDQGLTQHGAGSVSGDSSGQVSAIQNPVKPTGASAVNISDPPAHLEVDGWLCPQCTYQASS